MKTFRKIIENRVSDISAQEKIQAVWAARLAASLRRVVTHEIVFCKDNGLEMSGTFKEAHSLLKEFEADNLEGIK